MPGDAHRIVVSAERLTVDRSGARVLDSIDFQVGEGEVFALLGGNGAGKSTTLLTLLGFITPVSGRALLFGKEVGAHRAELHRELAYLPETAALYPHLTARENLRYFLDLSAVSVDTARMEAVLDEVGLASAARSERLERYSKGMRQKTAIALAMLRKAPLLLLDEPTSGLDPVAIEEFNALVQRLSAAGTTTVMVTHDLYGACEVAHRIALLKGGRLVERFESEGDGRIALDTVRRAFVQAAA